MIDDDHISELRRDITAAQSHKPPRFVEVDSRILGQLIDELENHRMFLLVLPREKREPALRD